MSEFVLDASLALQWFLEDESDRKYSLEVLASLSENRAHVPVLWFFEVGNGLLMAHRWKRISFEQIDGFLKRLKALPINNTQQSPSEILELPSLARKLRPHELRRGLFGGRNETDTATSYDRCRAPSGGCGCRSQNLQSVTFCLWPD